MVDKKMRDFYEEQLTRLHTQMIAMGSLCEKAIADATKALTDGDVALAKAVMEGDAKINQQERDIESMCIKLLLHQQPVAGDLRRVSAALKMVTDMERIGDQASDIAEIVMNLDYAEKMYFKSIEEMAIIARGMVQDSVEAFINQDIELARDVIDRDAEVDKYFASARDLMINLIVEHDHNAATIVDIIMIAKYLERIGDHATNIANWAIFHLMGEHPNRHPKPQARLQA